MIKIYEDGRRYRTETYGKGTEGRFLVGERVANGSLLTEFNEHGEVLDQLYLKNTDTLGAVKDYLKSTEVGDEFSVEKKEYKNVVIDYECPVCKKMSIVRELDLHAPETISGVPVVPVYTCRLCGRKFYSMTDAYLKKLVERNRDLFEEKEREEIDKSSEAAIEEMQEYIIRIFASKRISRIALKK